MLERASLLYIALIDTGLRNPTIHLAQLKLVVHHLVSLTIHTCVNLTPLFSSFVFLSLKHKHLDLRARAQCKYYDTLSHLDQLG